MQKSFDRMISGMEGVPDTVKSRPTTVRFVQPMVGSETFVVQTYRQKEQGDTIFVEHIGDEGYERFYLPPVVVKVIMRQRDTLETQNRRRVGRELAARAEAEGRVPFARKEKA